MTRNRVKCFSNFGNPNTRSSVIIIIIIIFRRRKKLVENWSSAEITRNSPLLIDNVLLLLVYVYARVCSPTVINSIYCRANIAVAARPFAVPLICGRPHFLGAPLFRRRRRRNLRPIRGNFNHNNV